MANSMQAIHMQPFLLPSATAVIADIIPCDQPEHN